MEPHGTLNLNLNVHTDCTSTYYMFDVQSRGLLITVDWLMYQMLSHNHFGSKSPRE